MTPSTQPGEAADGKGIDSSASSRLKPRRRDNLPKRPTWTGDQSSKKTSGPQLRRQSTVLVRKKLPWLDGPQQSKPGQVPGNFESKDGLAPAGAHDIPPTVPEKDVAPLSTRASISSPGGVDLALRAIGSTPSLRERGKPGTFKSLSLSSQPRPGVKSVTSKKEAEEVLGLTKGGPKRADYASSEYSATPSSAEVPATLPSGDIPSNERLDARTSAKVPSREPFHFVNEYLQSQLDLPLDPPVSPREKTDQSPRIRSSDSCRSCDAPPKLREMPKARTLPRRSVAMPPSQPSQPPPPPPPPAPPGRKPTLFAIPTHLLPSSSSSSPTSQPRAPVLPVMQAPWPVARAKKVSPEAHPLDRAVTGLENLMEEAFTMARNATQDGRHDEVANILDDATLALRKAGTIHGRMHTGRMSEPLVLSPAESGPDSGTDSIGPHSDASSMRGRDASVDTAPTLLTKSAQSSQQPLVNPQYKRGDRAPASEKAAFDDSRGRIRRASTDSISRTPPRLYQPASADSIVRDFAYGQAMAAKAQATRQLSASYGAAADYYNDTGQSVAAQPGVRASFSSRPNTAKPLPDVPVAEWQPPKAAANSTARPRGPRQKAPIQRLEPVATLSVPPRHGSRSFERPPEPQAAPLHHRRPRADPQHHHFSEIFESSYYHRHPHDPDRAMPDPANGDLKRGESGATDARYAPPPNMRGSVSEFSARYSDPPVPLQRDVSLKHPRRKHISLKEGQGFSLGRFHRRRTIAREWGTLRKRITATIACFNTMFIGLITGIYAGEVPRIQYQLADETHKVILGNVVLFSCLGLITLIFWPLPLLHGRKPYTLTAFALMLPLMFPQALAIAGYRNPGNPLYRCGLLIPRAFIGMAMGFANINFLPTLLDLFGASLMSEAPHQEIVVYDDVRRQGGGVGVWLGIWSFCFVGSMSIGFCIGAQIIATLDPAWGFYLVVILLAFFLLVNVIGPETRRAPYRRSVAQYVDDDEQLKRRVARGEVKLHISNDGPMWWFQEVWAGLILTKRMVCQLGFFILMLYLGWMYAQVTLVILLLGALLSRDYQWQPQYVGGAVLSVAVGALLAIPLSRANLFSRARDTPQRTDSMTMRAHHQRIHWSSHMLRRCVFTLTLPFAALAYTLTAPGPAIHWSAPTVFCGLVGFLSNLAIAECVGIIMEAFDTCDLQPGVNSKHRLQSLAETTRRRRTNYSSFPRVCAGFFAAQALGFFLSAASTGVSGAVTRALGAQIAIAIVAAILLVLTLLFILVLWRWRAVQVVPNHALGSSAAGKSGGGGGINWGPGADDPEWKPVVIGNPSGKMRRMNGLELGSLSRWTEIRKLNKLVRS